MHKSAGAHERNFSRQAHGFFPNVIQNYGKAEGLPGLPIPAPLNLWGLNTCLKSELAKYVCKMYEETLLPKLYLDNNQFIQY